MKAVQKFKTSKFISFVCMSIVYATSMFVLLAHANEEGIHEADTGSVSGQLDIEKTDKDIQIPRELIKQIEDHYLDIYNEDKRYTTEELKKAKQSIPRFFLNIDVALIQKTSGTLKHNAGLKLEKTGAVVDLGRILTQKPGSFYARVRLSEFEKGSDKMDLKNLKVFFLSNSPKRELQGENWGSGCNKLFDVTSYFNKQMSKKGVLVPTAEQRHLAVLGGTFYFVMASSEGLHLATLSFVDRRYPNRQCREI